MIVAVALMALTVLVPGPRPRAHLSPDFHWKGRIAPGKAIEIKGINGDVRASAASGNEVEVTAVKHARKNDPDEVEIKVVEHEGGVTICAVYPSRRASRPNDCAPGREGHSDTRDNDVEVEFTISVPAGVRFIGKTVNGGVEATGLDASVEVSTVNGGITVSTKGVAEATTVNGTINATIGRADWTGELEYSTVNGSINLTLPASFAAEIEAETVNGSIDTDFPLVVHGRINPRHLSGTIGAGGRELKLSTVNGSVRLRKA